jgi:aryl-alcohol dehydrogenase-like predicted oxidoreductase
VLAVAKEAGTGPVQVALAWLRHRAAAVRTSMIPIVGPRTPAHMDGYLDALNVELSQEQCRLLDEVSAIRLGTPHEDVAAALAHGTDGDRSLLDAPPVPVK